MLNILLNIGFMAAGFVALYFLLKVRLLKTVNPDSIITEIRAEVNQIIVELNSTTERNIGLIENKINTISELLTKADKKILLLQREGEKYNLSRNYSDIIKKTQTVPPPPEKEEPPVEENTRDKVIRLYKEGISANVISGRLNMPVGEIELIISLSEQ